MTASAFDAPPRPLAGGLGPSPPRRRPRTGVAPPPPSPPPPPPPPPPPGASARRAGFFHRRATTAAAAFFDACGSSEDRPPRARTDAGATGSSSLAAAFLAGFFPRLRLAPALPPPRPRPPPGPLDTAGFSPPTAHRWRTGVASPSYLRISCICLPTGRHPGGATVAAHAGMSSWRIKSARRSTSGGSELSRCQMSTG